MYAIMRLLLLSLLCVLQTTSAMAMARWCEHEPVPEQFTQEPTVSFKVFDVPPELLNEYCEWRYVPVGMAAGCTMDVGGGWWFVYIRSDFDAEEYACTLLHEKAHMPPNNWDHGDNYEGKVPGPKYRRPIHVDIFDFARGRVGHKVPVQALD